MKIAIVSTEEFKEEMRNVIKNSISNDRFSQYRERVINWANDKKILSKGKPMPQALKTLEEAQELVDAIKADDPEGIKDALGDVLVTIIIQAKMQNLDLLNCLEHALNIIEKRTGKMINGTFVKDKP